MKTSGMGASLLALAVSSALAADLPSVKGPTPIYPPTPIWAGFYAGLNAGYDWGTAANASTGSTPLFDAVALTANGLDPAHVVAGGLINGGTALANSGTAASLRSDSQLRPGPHCCRRRPRLRQY
jgi:outer membrane immunogenic protein